VRGGRKLKAVIPGGSSAPVLPADIMMNCTMDYDSIAKAGSMLGSGAVIVMDETRDMVESLLRLSTSTCTSPAASARPAAKARAGCGAWSTASTTARASQRHRPAELGGRQHPGPHHLRAGRRGGDAGARHDQALPHEFEAKIARPDVPASGRNQRPVPAGARG
jgi:NADH-quinone oxidoreductase subunit F